MFSMVASCVVLKWMHVQKAVCMSRSNYNCSTSLPVDPKGVFSKTIALYVCQMLDFLCTDVSSLAFSGLRGQIFTHN